MKNYKSKRKDLRDRKREVMEVGFDSSKDRKRVVESFKRESRSLKRSEKNSLRNAWRNEYGI